MSRKEIFQIEKDFSKSWTGGDPQEFYVASGFTHPRLPVITSDSFTTFQWGFIPSWSKDWEDAKKRRVQCLNAIAEEADTKPSFRSAIMGSRFCIVPVNGFYEWHHFNNNKYPHFIYPKKDSLFLMAGFYEQWANKEIGETHNTFTICTSPANSRMEWIHNSKKRMPLILSRDDSKLWIDTTISFSEKKKLIKEYHVDLMSDHPVSRLITSRKEDLNIPEVFEPFVYPELVLST